MISACSSALAYGLRQEFITPHCPQQNGMVERLIRTLKEQCASVIASKPCSMRGV
uniref:integrase core domain-containing protein n=1 Tax=Nitrosospira multiformis TaxID=1231 RepID=UPI001C631407